MLETDYILMITAGCLLAPESAKEKMVVEFGEHYELQSMKARGKISIGGNLPGQQSLPWKTWIGKLRGKKLSAVAVQYVPDNRPGLAAHIAAAFAGSVSFVLQAESGEGRETWYLRSESSRRTEMTSAQFADYIGSQPAKKLLWERIHQLINESNSLNNRPLVAEGETSAYLHGVEGEVIFDFLGDNLMSEIQIECAVNGTSLSFNPEQERFFDPPFDNPPAYFSSHSGKESVYFYLLREVNAEELNQIIDAQTGSAKIRAALSNQLTKNSDPELNGISDPETLFKFGTSAQLQILGRLVCQAIIDFCQENESIPELPSSLEAVFGPDKKDQLRARARGHSEKFSRLKPVETAWRYYQFEALTGFDVTQPSAEKTEEPEKVFRERLEDMTRFAEKQQLAFYAGLFRLAAYVISNAISSDYFVAADISRLADENGFREFNETLTNSLFYVSQLAATDWPAKKCFGILAASLTNVFGGMGSWNDQYFDGDNKEYDQVSADFFLAHELYFAAQLSSSNGAPGM